MARSRNCQESRRDEKLWSSNDPTANAFRRLLADRALLKEINLLDREGVDMVDTSETDKIVDRVMNYRNGVLIHVEIIRLPETAHVRLVS